MYMYSQFIVTYIAEVSAVYTYILADGLHVNFIQTNFALFIVTVF